jgi:hypothetical protein
VLPGCYPDVSDTEGSRKTHKKELKTKMLSGARESSGVLTFRLVIKEPRPMA